MAASVRGVLRVQNLLSRCANYRRFSTSSSLSTLDEHDAYYILLPQLPPDTPETNSVLKVEEPPKFKSVTPGSIVTACAKLSIEYETELDKLCEQLDDPEYPKTFFTIFEPLEKITVPLDCAYYTAEQLNWTSERQGYKKAFDRLSPQYSAAKVQRWVNTSLYNAIKEVKSDSQNLTEFQESLVDMYVRDGRQNGIEITGPDRTMVIGKLTLLDQKKTLYSHNVRATKSKFSHTVLDPSVIKTVPSWFKKATALDKHNPSKGPWAVTLDENIYKTFMAHCESRPQRFNIWRSKNNVAGTDFATDYASNHRLIEDIRYERRQIANYVGYENFGEMTMEHKMAGNVENVMNLIESCKTQFKDESHEEIEKLQEFALSQGFDERLELWDLPFWRHKQRQVILGCTEDDLAHYFPLQVVLEGLFDFSLKLFGIKIQECTSEVEVWDDSVSFYRIYDEVGGNVASFFIDPYIRPGKLDKIWMQPGRENSELCGTAPMSYLNLNLAPTLPNRPALMYLSQVYELFSTFGRGLQHMLTTVPYSEIAGQKNIHFDMLDVVGQFMGLWLDQPQTLKCVNRHWETGQTLSDETIENIIKANSHMHSYDTMRRTYFSAFDMELSVSKTYWYNIVEKLWPEYNVFNLHPKDIHPCSLTDIFTGSFPGQYYSMIWWKMIASDVFSAFEEAGLENEDSMAVLGRRYRDTFLSLGGAVKSNEVFRRFRGRDPSIESFMDRR